VDSLEFLEIWIFPFLEIEARSLSMYFA